MQLAPEFLARFEWARPSEPAVRMMFRRDGSGWYEREEGAGRRPTRENFIYRFEDATLHVKFARSRGWVATGAALRPGAAAPDARIGRHELQLDSDPWAQANEEPGAGPLLLLSDAGAALPA